MKAQKVTDKALRGIQLKTWWPWRSQKNQTPWQKEIARLEVAARMDASLGGGGLDAVFIGETVELCVKYALLRRTFNGYDAVIRKEELRADWAVFAEMVEGAGKVIERGIDRLDDKQVF